MVGRAIGIDFGTSTSLAAEGDATRGVTLAPLGRATTYLPSLVGFTRDGVVTGDEASDLPEQQILRSIKRYITERVETVPHPLVPGQTVSVDETIVEVLRGLAKSASVFFPLEADALRLGCPAMWDASQRNRLLRLAQEAGIPVAEHTLIDEPIAAGMAWVSHRVREFGDKLRGRLLVFDMGGGTLDVALLQVDSTAGDQFGEISVLASKGINEAGDRLDHAIRDDLVAMASEVEPDLDLDGLEEVRRRALTEARHAKVLLSSEDQAVIRMSTASVDLPTFSYSREQLEDAFASQLKAAEQLTWHVVRESFLTHEEHRSPSDLRRTPDSYVAKGVDHVLLAGGMSQVPAVRTRLERMFPKAQIHTQAGKRIRQDEAIVAGLAETTAYDRVNLHRPPFDFLLRFSTGETVPLYSAFAPLYEGWQAMQRDDLFYEKVVAAPDGLLRGSARLLVRSPMGRGVALNVVGQAQPLVEVPVGRRDIRFRVRPNGHILLVDGKGQRHHFRVNRWPVLRGADHAAIQLERLARSPERHEDRPWWREWENDVK